MLGDTITITYNTVAKVLSKINQDSYSSEYYLREATGEFRLRFRHQYESAKSGMNPVERHNLELSYTVFGATPELDRTYIQSATFRFMKGSDAVVERNVGLASVGWQNSANIDKLLGWES